MKFILLPLISKEQKVACLDMLPNQCGGCKVFNWGSSDFVSEYESPHRPYFAAQHTFQPS